MEHIVVDPQSPLPQGLDQITFSGHFIPVSTASHPRRMHNGTSVVDTSSSAISSGVWSGGELSFPVNLRIAGRHSPGLFIGQSYMIEGDITGANFLHVPHLTFITGKERNSNVRAGERARIQVRGVGKIEETKRHPIDNEHADPLLEVIVHHRDERAIGGYVCARCLLGWTFGPVDPTMHFFNGSRIFYDGILDGFDANSGKLLVEVTHVTVNFVAGLIEDDQSSIEELLDALDF
ncbi:hypothetical protein MJO28_012283 [Puccinia striiformis f. sp. tritici]|uniref:Uncharacterized protein n=1 Tax=Puccinia striiformis f. sp. tritici TaxID=168172 RepID=A0ACC0E0T2_9BASI|nr:hypothetical protein MJO28_012283 [Puccinia striiformis f. sp. tritici]KAI7945761.1 hypothetical protein MJO29_012149 [Puccinia striiformis f. sp. tritici]